MKGTKDKIHGTIPVSQRGLGPGSAGQSGDTQGLSSIPDVDSQSVEELVEEGQFFEAEVIRGIENAPDPDVAEVHTTEDPPRKCHRRLR